MITDVLAPPSLAVEPTAWIDAMFAALHREQSTFVDGDAAWWVLSFADVWDASSTRLSEHFAGQIRRGRPAQTAATYLAGWYAGALGRVVGTALVAGAVGVVPRADTIRWFVHPDGWVAGAEASLDLTVAVGHPWAGLPDISVVADERAVAHVAGDGLIALCRPIIDACRRLTRVGDSGLWNEVCDSIGMSLVYQRSIAPTELRVAALLAVIDRVDAPWRRRTRLWFVDDPYLGCVHVGQKGGCCLAYLEDLASAAAEGSDRPERDYCTTCSMRDADECARSQVAWHLERNR